MPTFPFPRKHRARFALLAGVVVWLAGCKNECPPLSIQEGEFCRWTRDGGVAGTAAHAGKTGSAGKSGNTAAKTIDPEAWSCEQGDMACNCVQGEGSGQDKCDNPKPGCCYAYPDNGKQHCNCVATDSPACSDLYKRTGSGVAASCPL